MELDTGKFELEQGVIAQKIPDAGQAHLSTMMVALGLRNSGEPRKRSPSLKQLPEMGYR